MSLMNTQSSILLDGLQQRYTRFQKKLWNDDNCNEVMKWFFYLFQLNLCRVTPRQGGWTDLMSHGRLSGASPETISAVRRCWAAFEDVHGSVSLNVQHSIDDTIERIQTRCPEVDRRIVKCYTKMKYHLRIKVHCGWSIRVHCGWCKWLWSLKVDFAFGVFKHCILSWDSMVLMRLVW